MRLNGEIRSRDHTVGVVRDGLLTECSETQDFLPKALVSTMRGMLDAREDRMCSLLFKLAVEMAVMRHVTAAANEVDPDVAHAPARPLRAGS